MHQSLSAMTVALIEMRDLSREMARIQLELPGSVRFEQLSPWSYCQQQ
jgi:hypothetical protein